jgi:hypothetical protein
MHRQWTLIVVWTNRNYGFIPLIMDWKKWKWRWTRNYVFKQMEKAFYETPTWRHKSEYKQWCYTQKIFSICFGILHQFVIASLSSSATTCQLVFPPSQTEWGTVRACVYWPVTRCRQVPVVATLHAAHVWLLIQHYLCDILEASLLYYWMHT